MTPPGSASARSSTRCSAPRCRVADADGFLFTGSLSLRTHPWLAEHTVHGQVVVPGTALVELAVRAADETGLTALEELTLQTPLVLPETGAVQVQLWAGAPEESGRRPLTVHSRPHGAGEWTLHATGSLAATAATPECELTEWPPPGAEAVSLEGRYDELAAAGLGYGETFQGLQAVWQDGEDTYAEVTLPEGARDQAGRFGLHPALLDAALHALAAGDGPARLPFAWSDVVLHASGAAELRVKLTPSGTDAVSLQVADGTGAPVAIVSLVVRPVSAAQLRPSAQRRRALRGDLAAAIAGRRRRAAATRTGRRSPDRCRLPCRRRRRRARADGSPARPSTSSRRSSPTSGTPKRSCSSTRGQSDVDPVAAAVWGLVRSAQSEHPGRFLLADAEDTDATPCWPPVGAADRRA